MRRFIKLTPPLFLFAIIIIASIAAAPATLATPDAPTAQATANGGEMTVSWNQVPGAQYYTVGWVNWTDAKPISDAGEDWLSQFHYTTVLGSETSYTVKGLDGGDDHYAIIRATDIEGIAGRFGGGWSMFSAWSLPVQPADFTESSSQPTSEEATIPGRPTASAECYMGQQLTPGQSCWFSVPYENPDPVFAVTDGGPYHGYGQWWFSDGFDFFSTGSHGHLWAIDGADHIFEVTRQGSVWVVEQYGPDTEQPTPGTPTQPTEGTSFLSISPSSACQQPVQQLTKGEGCRWDLQHSDVGIFHVVEGGEFDGRLFVRFFGDDHDFVHLHSTGYYQIGDEVLGDLEIEREGSVWTLKQVDHVAEHLSSDGSTVLNIPSAPEDDCYVGLQIGPGEGCVVPDPDDPNGYRFHGSVIYGGDYHGRFIRIDDDGDIKLSKPDATMVITTNYPRGGDSGYRFEAKKLAGDVWEIVKVNEQVQR